MLKLLFNPAASSTPPFELILFQLRYNSCNPLFLKSIYLRRGATWSESLLCAKFKESKELLIDNYSNIDFRPTSPRELFERLIQHN